MMGILLLTCCLVATALASDSDSPTRRGPNFLYTEPDGGKLLVLCEKSGTVARVDPESGDIEAETEIGEWPYALAAHPDGERIYVSCRRSQEVVELDAHSLVVLRSFSLRGDPTGVAVSADGRRLYVGLNSLNQLAVVDLASGVDIKRLVVGRGPEAVRLSPRKDYVYVTNLLTNPVPPDQSCRIEVTVIDDNTAHVAKRIELFNANIGRQIAFTSDGSLAIAAISRPKNLIPEVQIARGWVVTNGFALIDPDSDSPPMQLLVDLPNQFYSDPYAVAVTADDRKFYLSAAGYDMVIAVDLERVREVCADIEAGEIARPSDHLGLSRRYVTARIPVGANPRALAISADGRWLYVGNRLDDAISVIDTETDQVDRTLVLGNPAPPDRLLQGERFFYSAARTFQNQFGCISCHPEGGVDGLQYDLEPDGIGQNILDNRSLRDVSETAPFKWTGKNPDIATQCGSRTAKWIVRTRWLTPAEVVILVEYIHSIPPVENPYLGADGKLTGVQRRGKKFFERTTTNFGEPIPLEN
jgi:YVTN family beta-propeller protein